MPSIGTTAGGAYSTRTSRPIPKAIKYVSLVTGAQRKLALTDPTKFAVLGAIWRHPAFQSFEGFVMKSLPFAVCLLMSVAALVFALTDPTLPALLAALLFIAVSAIQARHLVG